MFSCLTEFTLVVRCRLYIAGGAQHKAVDIGRVTKAIPGEGWLCYLVGDIHGVFWMITRRKMKKTAIAIAVALAGFRYRLVRSERYTVR